jgi:hypothetical protein
MAPDRVATPLPSHFSCCVTPSQTRTWRVPLLSVRAAVVAWPGSYGNVFTWLLPCNGRLCWLIYSGFHWITVCQTSSYCLHKCETEDFFNTHTLKAFYYTLIIIVTKNAITVIISVYFTSLLNSVVLVRERTIPTERPPLVGEVSAKFCW